MFKESSGQLQTVTHGGCGSQRMVPASALITLALIHSQHENRNSAVPQSV